MNTRRLITTLLVVGAFYASVVTLSVTLLHVRLIPALIITAVGFAVGDIIACKAAYGINLPKTLINMIRYSATPAAPAIDTEVEDSYEEDEEYMQYLIDTYGQYDEDEDPYGEY